MFRNRWTVCSGMGGHNGAEWLDSFQRNEWSLCGGIRNSSQNLGRIYATGLNRIVRQPLRIFKLIEAIMRDPFQGIGKPEPLKFLGPGVWSRRITQEHRLVYVVVQDRIDFVQTRYHY